MHHHKHACGILCGIVMLGIGLVWLAVKLGWIPGNLLTAVPIVPLALISIGTLILVSAVRRAFRKGRPGTDSNSCCS